METKNFHIGDVLSITDGRLVSPRHIEGVYDILNWMTGESLFTHQLPRVAREAAPVILAMHPQLSSVSRDDAVDGKNMKEWLADKVHRFGEFLPVPKLNADQHESIDAMSEIAGMIHPCKIIPVQL